MTDTPTPKTFTESEMLAILNDRVTAATAALTKERDDAIAARDKAASDLDIANAAHETEKARATAAEEALATKEREIAEAKEIEAKKGERVKKLRESASHLDEKWFEDEPRMARILAKSDEDFESFVTDLAATAPAGGPAPLRSVPTPRETAMEGAPATPVGSSAARGALMGGA